MSTSVPESDEELRARLLASRPQAAAALDRLTARFAGRAGQGPFASAETGRCPACRVGISAVEGSRMRAGEFVTCPSCGRFLYITRKAAPSGAEPPAASRAAAGAARS